MGSRGRKASPIAHRVSRRCGDDWSCYCICCRCSAADSLTLSDILLLPIFYSSEIKLGSREAFGDNSYWESRAVCVVLGSALFFSMYQKPLTFLNLRGGVGTHTV